MRLNIARENMIKAVVISGTRNVPGIADGDRCQSGTVTSKTPRQFFGEMHGIAHRAAVPTAENAVSRQEGCSKKATRVDDGLLGIFISPQPCQRKGRVVQCGGNGFTHVECV